MISCSDRYDKTIRIWNLESGQTIRVMTGHTDWISSIELMSKSKLVSGSLDHTIKEWNLDNGECVRTVGGHSSPVSSLVLLI